MDPLNPTLAPAPAALDDGRERPAEPDIHLAGVSKRFGATLAVDDLTLSIQRGAFYALLGPSGCGKTTTLRMIGGFENPSQGSVFLAGQEVTELPPHRRDVNTVFQSYALFPHLNVQSNVAFGLQRRGVGRDEVRRRVGEALELVQLAEMGPRKPAQLSGGQQQRVALARALVNRPRALLLDEPLGALDLRLRRELQMELKRIQQEVGITFLHVTHDQEEAMTMADEIAVMANGRIEQAGSADQLYETPATEFVANFLGTSNLIDGTLDRTDGDLAEFRTHDGALVRVPRDRVPPAGGSGVLRVGVRPEKIALRPADGASGPPPANALRGRIVLSAYLGVALQFVVRTAGGEELTVVAPNRDEAGTRRLTPGDEAWLSWEPRHTFVVSKEESHG